MRDGAAVIALAAVALALAVAAPASEGRDGARCPRGSVAGVIDGNRVCLRAGEKCKRQLDRQYHRYGFHCHSGRLTRATEPPRPLPAAGRITARVPVPAVGGIATGGGAVWVASLADNTVTRLDPGSNSVQATIALSDPALNPGFGPTFLVFAHDALWVLDGGSSSVHRIDPTTNRIVTSIPLGVPTQATVAPLGITATADAVWVANRWGTEDALTGSVVRIDPRSNQITARTGLGQSPTDSGPTSIAAGAGAVWVGVPSEQAVVRLDPATGSVVARVTGLPCADGQVAADDETATVWSADYCARAVHRIDARTNKVVRTTTVPRALGSGVQGVAAAFGSIWIQAGPLYRLNPATGELTGVLELPPVWNICEYSIAAGFGSLWVRHIDEVIRVQP